MSCLFGYCGSPADDLLARMAALLSHRCPSGWERASGVTATGETVAIGHGMATPGTGNRNSPGTATTCSATAVSCSTTME